MLARIVFFLKPNLKILNNLMTDSINDIRPGQVLSPEQKEKLAKDNLAASSEAQRLAAEHRARDIQTGKGEPVVKTVAELLKEKLVREEFQKKEE